MDSELRGVLAGAMTDEDPHDALSAVMGLLFEVHPAQLSCEEIRRELAGLGQTRVDDALAHLTRVGLAHKRDDFCWATRAATEADDLTR
jgi:hypothetical protein